LVRGADEFMSHAINKNPPVIPSWLMACVANQYAAEDWLRDLQKQLGQDFLQRGIPMRREELWKYTDISFLANEAFNKSSSTHDHFSKLAKNQSEALADCVAAKRLKSTDTIWIVLVNGNFVEALSDLQLLPHGVIVCGFKQALQQHADEVKAHLTNNLDLARHPFASLNAALLSDGVFISLPKNAVVKATIQILYITTEDKHFFACPRNMIIAGENSEVTILEEHATHTAENYFMNVVTDIHAAAGAKVHYHKIQNDSPRSTHIAQLFINQSRDSVVKTHALLVGARLDREDVFVNLNANGAESSVNGFYCLTHDGQHIDNHIQIDHVAPHGTSNMIYKGVLDKKSRAVFNGKIYVHKDAQKTQSYQANHNLLLSADAEVDTKPEFEIYADDVKCAHGDTVGQLDRDALFYLRSRGIENTIAMKLLTYAFAADVMNAITQPEIKQRMTELLNEKLIDDTNIEKIK
jgi:Fe-S cluster assembly protein SufD